MEASRAGRIASGFEFNKMSGVTFWDTKLEDGCWPVPPAQRNAQSWMDGRMAAGLHGPRTAVMGEQGREATCEVSTSGFHRDRRASCFLCPGIDDGRNRLPKTFTLDLFQRVSFIHGYLTNCSREEQLRTQLSTPLTLLWAGSSGGLCGGSLWPQRAGWPSWAGASQWGGPQVGLLCAGETGSCPHCPLVSCSWPGLVTQQLGRCLWADMRCQATPVSTVQKAHSLWQEEL